MRTCPNVSSLGCKVDCCDSDLSGSVVLSKSNLHNRWGQRERVFGGGWGREIHVYRMLFMAKAGQASCGAQRTRDFA